MNKAFWSHFKHFGRLLEKKLSGPHSQQVWWKSSQQARCTYNQKPDLLGSFPEDVCPDITGQLGVVIGQNSALQWAGVGEVSDKQPIAAICQQYFKGHIIFSKSSSQKKDCLKNRYFEEQIRWVPLTFVPTQKLSVTVWAISLRFVCLFQMPMNAQRQPSVTSSMATVPIPLVPIFVPANLVSLVMEGTVLVRLIQICFCKNNHIPAMNLTWIEK